MRLDKLTASVALLLNWEENELCFLFPRRKKINESGISNFQLKSPHEVDLLIYRQSKSH